MPGTILVEKHEKGFWMADWSHIGPGEWKNSEELNPSDGYCTRPTKEEVIARAKEINPDYTVYTLFGECECEPNCGDESCGVYWQIEDDNNERS